MGSGGSKEKIRTKDNAVVPAQKETQTDSTRQQDTIQQRIISSSPSPEQQEQHQKNMNYNNWNQSSNRGSLPTYQVPVRNTLNDVDQTTTSRRRINDPHDVIMRTLTDVANQAIANPPGPVFNSPSYSMSLDEYNRRCVTASEAELEAWLSREIDALKYKTTDEMLKAEYNGMSRQRLDETPQMDEFRLQLAALVHCYGRERADWDRRLMMIDNERQEDVAFLRSLTQRVEVGQANRQDVLSSMADYSQRCRGKRSGSGAAALSTNTGATRTGQIPAPASYGDRARTLPAGDRRGYGYS